MHRSKTALLEEIAHCRVHCTSRRLIVEQQQNNTNERAKTKTKGKNGAPPRRVTHVRGRGGGGVAGPWPSPDGGCGPSPRSASSAMTAARRLPRSHRAVAAADQYPLARAPLAVPRCARTERLRAPDTPCVRDRLVADPHLSDLPSVSGTPGDFLLLCLPFFFFLLRKIRRTLGSFFFFASLIFRTRLRSAWPLRFPTLSFFLFFLFIRFILIKLFHCIMNYGAIA